jgi:hypothetical protein
MTKQGDTNRSPRKRRRIILLRTIDVDERTNDVQSTP